VETVIEGYLNSIVFAIAVLPEPDAPVMMTKAILNLHEAQEHLSNSNEGLWVPCKIASNRLLPTVSMEPRRAVIAVPDTRN
jgi:hypothetical protein